MLSQNRRRVQGGAKRGISRDGHNGCEGSSSSSHPMKVGQNVRAMAGDVAERIRWWLPNNVVAV